MVYPSLFLKFFRQLIFPCRHTCSSEALATIPISLLVLVENVFTFLVFYFLWSASCTLAITASHEAFEVGSYAKLNRTVMQVACSLALKARAEVVPKWAP